MILLISNDISVYSNLRQAPILDWAGNVVGTQSRDVFITSVSNKIATDLKLDHVTPMAKLHLYIVSTKSFNICDFSVSHITSSLSVIIIMSISCMLPKVE